MAQGLRTPRTLNFSISPKAWKTQFTTAMSCQVIMVVVNDAPYRGFVHQRFELQSRDDRVFGCDARVAVNSWKLGKAIR